MSIQDEARELLEQNRKLLERLQAQEPEPQEERFDIGKMIDDMGLPQDDLRVKALYSREFADAHEARAVLTDTLKSIAFKAPTPADRAAEVTRRETVPSQTESLDREYQNRIAAITSQKNISQSRRIDLIARAKRDMVRKGWEGS